MDELADRHPAGFPIWLTNNDVAPVGIVLVSGLPQAEDHQLIVSTACERVPCVWMVADCSELLASGRHS